MTDSHRSIDRKSLVDALERAKDRPVWTERLVDDALDDPKAMKAAAKVCNDCSAPCDEAEVCVTMLAQEGDLLEQVGRDQAFAHVESGMERLEITERATVRSVDSLRPNTFVSELTTDI